jgi:co-chaperonin GroES (HSP10)
VELTQSDVQFLETLADELPGGLGWFTQRADLRQVARKLETDLQHNTNTPTHEHTMHLADDYVLLEEIKNDTKIELLNAREIQPSIVKAKVMATGPGEYNITGGRNAISCQPEDIVLVHSGAGIHFIEGGKDFWFVYAGRKDIIAVINE